jgi:acyl-CoA thioester hydrolase
MDNIRSKPHTIIRRRGIQVAFHQVDMMQVVHNAVYFKWFEKGRLDLLEEVFPVAWAIEHRFATPVVMNHAEYLWPAAYGDPLVLTTRHQRLERWDGRFVFDHSISNSKTKVELCLGQTAITVLDLASGQLLKEIPEEIWSRYQALQ